MVSGFELFDSFECVTPSVLALSAHGQGEAGPVVSAPQLGGHQQDFLAQGLQRGGLELGR
jgi:hypothetical protein